VILNCLLRVEGQPCFVVCRLGESESSSIEKPSRRRRRNSLLRRRRSKVSSAKGAATGKPVNTQTARQDWEQKDPDGAAKVVAKAANVKKEKPKKKKKEKPKKKKRLSLKNLIQSDGTIDLTHCISEGGKQQCAECEGHNSMCQQVYRASSDLYCGNSRNCGRHVCPTTWKDELSEGKVFVLWTSQKSESQDGKDKTWGGTSGKREAKRHCRSFVKAKDVDERGEGTGRIRITNAGWGYYTANFFNLPNVKDAPYMVTKILIAHPNYASTAVGAIGVKRVLMHKHSVTGEWVADVSKHVECVKCDPAPFRDVNTNDANTTELSAFLDCAKAKITEGKGKPKGDAQCTGEDMEYFSYLATVF